MPLDGLSIVLATVGFGGSVYALSLVGDYALFFRKAAVEITFENERYLVVPQSAILALVREEEDR